MAELENNVRVLILDGDKTGFSLVESVFQKISGYNSHLEWTPDYQTAIHCLREKRHDLCLISGNLQGGTGSDFLQEALPINPQVPFILLTDSDSHLYQKAMALGASDCLEKNRLDAFILERSLRFALEQAKIQSELKVARQQAEKANKIKGDFLAGISHEIRTPMNGIIGMSELLLGTSVSRQQKKYLEYIRQSANSLVGLINNLLDSSKMEAGKLEIESIHFKLRDFIEHTLFMFLEQGKAKSLDIIWEISPSSPDLLIGDPFRVRQILNNLVGNAIKYTNEGKITVHVEPVSSKDADAAAAEIELHFSVSDTGIGISRDKLHVIFESYQQSHESDSRVYGGTGLGLTICKQLVELMGGRIWVESREGLGSTFHFTVPFILDSEAEIEYQKEGNRNSETGQGGIPEGHIIQVLLVEDDLINQEVAVGMLKKWPSTIVIAPNGEEALEKCKSKAFDIIFMDIEMPELSGIDATRAIRQDALYSLNYKTPIIAMTGHAKKEDREQFLEAGMTDILIKPVSADAIATVLYAYCCRDHKIWEDRETSLQDGRIVAGKNISNPVSYLNVDDAFARLQGDSDLYRSIIDIFLQSSPEQIKSVKNAFFENHFQQVAFVSHSLKSTAANIGAMYLSDCASQLEQFAKEKKREQMQYMLKQLEIVYRKTVKEVMELNM